MADLGPTPDPVGELTCSTKGCRAQATHGLLWNNPKIHSPERRKVWLACGEHLEYLSEYLAARDFLKDVAPVSELERSD